MKKTKIIALLSDFGLTDHYVACVKGAILSANPSAVIVDICHAIKTFAIREGAFLLREAYQVFPEGTIFVAVVDPGVGSKRKALCIKTKKGYLIGPDNGVLTLALSEEKNFEAREIENDRYFRKPVSTTFHGRDIFGPVAAALSKKNIFRSLGPVMCRLKQLDIPHAQYSHHQAQGRVLYVDRFGNVVTNIERKKIKTKLSNLKIQVRKLKLRKIAGFFGEGKKGELIAVWNSSDFLEFAVANDSAEQKFGLKVNDQVVISK